MALEPGSAGLFVASQATGSNNHGERLLTGLLALAYSGPFLMQLKPTCHSGLGHPTPTSN